MNRPTSLIKQNAMGCAAIAILIVAGCNANFEKQWSAAMRIQPAEPILGCWDGTWNSKSTGHSGRLRMIVAKVDSGYQANFLAVYGGVFSFGMTIPLEPEQSGDKTTFRSDHDLGWMWGKFKWNGQFTPEQFEADYDSVADKGTFTLKRPKPKNTTQSEK